MSVLAGTAGPLTGLDPSDSSTLPTGGNADGQGTAATFNSPTAIGVDGADNLYVADVKVGNGAQLVRKIDSSGNVTTLATLGTDPGAPMRIYNFVAIGNALYAASGDGYVWYLTLSGTLTQLAGTENSIDFFPNGYDPTVAHPALELALPTAIGSADENGTGSFSHIAYHDGAVYYRGFANGASDFVERIACP